MLDQFISVYVNFFFRWKDFKRKFLSLAVRHFDLVNAIFMKVSTFFFRTRLPLIIIKNIYAGQNNYYSLPLFWEPFFRNQDQTMTRDWGWLLREIIKRLYWTLFILKVSLSVIKLKFNFNWWFSVDVILQKLPPVGCHLVGQNTEP